MSIQLLQGSSKDLGGFSVARLLPQLRQRAVGSFIFLDHMGPARFAPGAGIDVRPHPHIGLATVTFLFEGALLHRDSLGSVQEIRPGDVNWMTAGRGIVHSERTPPALRETGSPLLGLQAWVALPREHEEAAPDFAHYPAAQMPRIERAGVELQLIAGEAFGERSPVRTLSDLHYLAGSIGADGRLELPASRQQRAVYVVDGEIGIGDAIAPGGTLAVLDEGTTILRGRQDARIAILGGAPLDGDRHLWWNFVSSRAERIEQAKADWREGRFAAVPGERESIPLPG